MTTDRHKVNVVIIDVYRDLAHSLSRVCVEKDLVLSAHLTYLLCGLDDACMPKGVKCMIIQTSAVRHIAKHVYYANMAMVI